MRTALLNTPLSEHLDGMVISAETGFLKPAREAFDAVIALAGELLRTRSDSRPPQFIFLADGGSFDADRTNDAGGPYTELQGADEAEFDSVLQVDHVRESNGELIYERRDTGWPEMLSFHDVTTALYALNARP
jgi:FMN phosphatase YigB (HAD superfamily)